MKKIIITLAIPILLTGCSGETEKNTENIAGKVPYETATFSILVPPDWETINTANFTTNFPSPTQVAFRNNIRNEIYTANVNVTIREIGEEVETKDFAKSMLTNAQKSLQAYEELGNSESIMKYGEEEIMTVMYEFQGKKSTVEPVIKFRELYIANKGQGIAVTSAYLPNETENVVNLANEMLDSFSLK